MSGLLDFLQGASNSAASNVSAPVDGIAWLLRKAGLPARVGAEQHHTMRLHSLPALVNVLELSAVTGHRSLKSLQRYYNPTPADIANKLG